MELPWGDGRTKQFVTNAGLITSTGPHGPNIATCEWTHHVSYSPGIIAVCFRPEDASCENISATKELGVNIASTEQATLTSTSGHYTGRELDKIGLLEELGFGFYKAKKIKPPMVKDAVINVECRIVKEMPLGDHVMFIGEVLEASANAGKDPIAYNMLMYGRVVHDMPKPSDEERKRLAAIAEKYRKKLKQA